MNNIINTAKNPLILQGYEWDLPSDGQHWNRLRDNAENLRGIGINTLWLPPAYKGNAGSKSVGYDVYDKYDLGEFNQKGSIRTKYGTKDEYVALIDTMHEHGVAVLADIVLNHLIGADAPEPSAAVECKSEDRNILISRMKSIESWTRFNFTGRNGKYSASTWDHSKFNGVDYDNKERKCGIYLLDGKTWNRNVDWANGNYEYLMGANIDMENPEVVRELEDWGRWYLDETDVDGFRLDAVKHISYEFYPAWLAAMRRHRGSKLFAVGEYWSSETFRLEKYLDHVEDLDSPYTLFDVPLHFALYNASMSGSSYNLSKVFSNTLLAARPENAVTFVDNHDTQPGQALFSYIGADFKQRAYALTLFQEKGIPCVFYGDLVGLAASRHDPDTPYNPFESPENQIPDLARMCMARSECAYGPQEVYDVNEHVYAYSRGGTRENRHSGMAVLVTNDIRNGASQEMYISVRYKSENFINLLNPTSCPVRLDEYGRGAFYVEKNQASVWIRESAYRYLTSRRQFNWLT